ncbi:DUF659 domain-containing protein [Mycena venus]|uniref:DUF659 domain-containing protein n=1 Tax=Mycena venus TaxID=2733690 RepID=A0A8H7CNJ8_9AGAR|nr:DUF659 domain-containing protein [Mycena venus]
MNGCSAVAEDVINTVLRTPNFWPLLRQLTRVAKPIVDAIGNCESRQTTLADCMLELLRRARTLSKMMLEDDEDASFLAHAKETFDRRFIKIATPVHWLALFLHPSCRKLALSGDSAKGQGKSLNFMLNATLKIAQQWQWDEAKARQLVADIKDYERFTVPFSGTATNAKAWWEAIPKKHDGLRTLAIVLQSIVPHPADVERLFSGLGGIQSPHRNGWLVDTMEKVGRVRNHLSYLLVQKGKSTERKHGHMHSRSEPGIDGDLAKELANPITWIPPLGDDEGTDPEEDIVQKAYDDLQKKITDEAQAAAAGLGEGQNSTAQGSVVGGEIVSFHELDRVDRGESLIPPKEFIEVVGSDTQKSWSIDSLL